MGDTTYYRNCRVGSLGSCRPCRGRGERPGDPVYPLREATGRASGTSHEGPRESRMDLRARAVECRIVDMAVSASVPVSGPSAIPVARPPEAKKTQKPRSRLRNRRARTARFARISGKLLCRMPRYRPGGRSRPGRTRYRRTDPRGIAAPAGTTSLSACAWTGSEPIFRI
jgi:hypothetical protein